MRHSLASLGIRQKLVLLSLGILLVVSFAFTLLHLRMSRNLAEEDLQERAVAFAREIAATIGDRREFENGALLSGQIARIMAVRQNVAQLDALAFGAAGTRVVATSHPASRLPLTRQNTRAVARGQVVSRLVTGPAGRYWEVVAPVILDGQVVGAIAAKFSLDRADALAARVSAWALGLTAVSVLVMGLLMSGAVELVVNRPIRRFLGVARRAWPEEPAPAGAAEPPDERDRRHALRGDDHGADVGGGVRRGDRGRRHRIRDPAGRARAHLRAVLLGESRTSRRRPRALHRLRDRARASRTHRPRQRAEMPVPGETTVIPVAAIRRFVGTTPLADYLAR